MQEVTATKRQIELENFHENVTLPKCQTIIKIFCSCISEDDSEIDTAN